MVGIEETRARAAGPRPPAVQAGEAALVEVDAPLGPAAAATDAGVRHEQATNAATGTTSHHEDSRPLLASHPSSTATAATPSRTRETVSSRRAASAAWARC